MCVNNHFLGLREYQLTCLETIVKIELRHIVIFMIRTLNNYVMCTIIFTLGMEKVSHEYNYMTMNKKYNNF
jgi:hypothetical protein